MNINGKALGLGLSIPQFWQCMAVRNRTYKRPLEHVTMLAIQQSNTDLSWGLSTYVKTTSQCGTGKNLGKCPQLYWEFQTMGEPNMAPVRRIRDPNFW